MRTQAEFCISFDNEIEEIVMNTPNNSLSKSKVRIILNDSIQTGILSVRERCEGSVLYDIKNDKIKIKSKSCIAVGRDWNEDVWKKNKDIFFPTNRLNELMDKAYTRK